MIILFEFSWNVLVLVVLEIYWNCVGILLGISWKFIGHRYVLIYLVYAHTCVSLNFIGIIFREDISWIGQTWYMLYTPDLFQL